MFKKMTSYLLTLMVILGSSTQLVEAQDPYYTKFLPVISPKNTEEFIKLSKEANLMFGTMYLNDANKKSHVIDSFKDSFFQHSIILEPKYDLANTSKDPNKVAESYQKIVDTYYKSGNGTIVIPQDFKKTSVNNIREQAIVKVKENASKNNKTVDFVRQFNIPKDRKISKEYLIEFDRAAKAEKAYATTKGYTFITRSAVYDEFILEYTNINQLQSFIKDLKNKLFEASEKYFLSPKPTATQKDKYRKDNAIILKDIVISLKNIDKLKGNDLKKIIDLLQKERIGYLSINSSINETIAFAKEYEKLNPRPNHGDK